MHGTDQRDAALESFREATDCRDHPHQGGIVAADLGELLGYGQRGDYESESVAIFRSGDGVVVVEEASDCTGHG